MILISHRGNINGKILEKENSPEYILESIESGYDCEIDVRYIDGDWFLGHDKPEYKINSSFLDNNKLWIHAKNIWGLRLLLNTNKNVFWHENDEYTITSSGFIWQYPSKNIIENSICVLPELNNIKKEDLNICSGICSDYIGRYT